MKKIVMFLADNIGSNISVSSIGNILVNEGLLEDGRKKEFLVLILSRHMLML